MSSQGQLQGEAQGQLQGQAEAQLQAQLEAQGQLQGQGQGQLQGQGQGQGQDQNQSQAQLAVQAVGQYSESENKNENENENKNENEIDNKVESDVDSDIDSEISNKIENEVESKTDVEVEVDVAVNTPPDDEDVIDIDELKIDDLDGIAFINPDDVEQSVTTGVNFNVDQINNLVDNDRATDSTVKFESGWNGAESDGDGDGAGSTFSMYAEAEGGESKMDDVTADVGGNAGDISDLATATADGVASNSAFNQTLTLGGNIQFNQMEVEISAGTMDGI